MSTPITTILAKKPISSLQKPIKADAKGIFKGLLKAAAHGASGRWVELAPDAGEIITSLGLKTTDEEVAWLLIQRSFQQALFDLVSPNFHLLPKEADTRMKAISDELDSALERNELVIDDSFFESPERLEILQIIQNSLRLWFKDYGLEESRINTIVDRLPIFFSSALHQEWKRHPDIYNALQKTSPFAGVVRRVSDWDGYYAWLRQQVDESMLQETFSLKQVYVSLRAYYLKDIRNNRDGGESKLALGRDKDAVRVVVDLQQQMNKWLNEGNKKDALRIISGGPGSGKSSFVKMWAASLTERTDLRVVYVPLHLLNSKDSLENALGAFIRREGFLSENPFDIEGQRLLLLFDGLDELAMRGKLAEEVARNFVREIEKTLTQYNQRKLRIQAVISGREVVIQANSSEFRNEGEVLYVLSYHERLEQNDENGHLLNEDQRIVWWKNYGIATGQNYDGLPKRLKRRDLDEITAQPLLNYLVALSYDINPDKTKPHLDFSGEVSLNLIYKDLLGKVYQRGWEGGRNLAVQGLDELQFGRILEEIALAAWHGNGRTTTVTDIEQHCQANGLSPLLKRFEDGAKVGVTRLLAAFYFRQYGNDPLSGDPTFEFTHKSFGEYLMACRIARTLKRIQEELKRHENYEGGWNEAYCLRHWAEVCGPSALNDSILKFLRQEVALHEKEQVREWQSILCHLITIMLRYGMPMELISPRSSYKKEDEQARNAEEALLIAVNSTAIITEEVNKVDWLEETQASVWLARLRGLRIDESYILPFQCLSYMNLNDAFLRGAELRGAELHGANLSGANLRGAELRGANLCGANLRGVNLSGADLSGADLSRANLNGADLSETYLRETDLSETDLRSANLRGANLRGADLRRADLRRADLSGAELSGADLRRAELREAELDGTELNGAYLSGANLSAAYLSGANLNGAHLSDNNPGDANLN